ncbi:GntR family transcriptional regulator [Streptomyces sp. IB201691-2A2]|uniref:GntR family transcriptional regulator n=1 Tax=Streptomyces sp. IB201691-2A2 TaxID=2561920 RepID=UPI00117EFA64|nr:GntR family transcriptional regulator [Streptomyces sp. IB201691-2A2]TRO56211.1 GntR family transcriptional regulator [Streptomyces sp. IB201691-2A2]
MARSFEDKRSAHQKIAAGLRRQITRGDLAPGAQLPSTPALMEQYGVAGTTIQKALLMLKEEELLLGQPGKGVFVKGSTQQAISPAVYMPPAATGEPYRWISEAEKRSQRGSSKLLEVAVVTPPYEVARALGLEEGGQSLLRKQILLLDEEPTELTRSYYPLELAEGTAMMEHRRIRGGTPTLLSELGHPPREFVDEVSSEIPTEEEVVALELPKDMPVMLTFRIVYSDDERPIEVSLLAKAAHRYRMRYRIPVP